MTSTEIAEDPEVVKSYLEHGNTDFRFLSEKFRKDKNLILKYSREWEDADQSLHNDKEVLMHYFKTSKNRRVPILSEDMIVEAAKHGKECDIGDCFSNELVLKLLDYSIPENGNLLAYFIKENEHILEERVLKRISELNPIFVLLNLNYDDISLTKEQVLKYINEIEGSFENVPRKWREDREVAKAALVKSYHNYAHIGSELAKDIDFLTPIVENYAIPLSMPNTLLELFKNDKDIIRKVLNKNPLLLPYYPYKLDKEFLDTLGFRYSNGRLHEILHRSSYEHYCKLYESNFKE